MPRAAAMSPKEGQGPCTAWSRWSRGGGPAPCGVAEEGQGPHAAPPRRGRALHRAMLPKEGRRAALKEEGWCPRAISSPTFA